LTHATSGKTKRFGYKGRKSQGSKAFLGGPTKTKNANMKGFVGKKVETKPPYSKECPTQGGGKEDCNKKRGRPKVEKRMLKVVFSGGAKSPNSMFQKCGLRKGKNV